MLQDVPVKHIYIDRESMHAAEAEMLLHPVRGNRRYAGGFYDRAEPHGPVTGSGPGFEEAVRKHEERQKQRGLPGVWRKNPYPSKGTQRDIDYAVMEWY